MEFDGYDWDASNSEKCQKHGLSITAIESVFDRAVLVLPDRDHVSGERRFRAIGTTSDGHKAFIVFTTRGHRGTRLIRPISARHMHQKEVAHYEKAYPNV
jgi:uncharacterized DUF497 family protein